MKKIDNWQVFFLPKGISDSGGENFESPGIVAFCPFTGYMAEGRTILEASEKWIREAKNQGQEEALLIPKYIFTTVKVWCGDGNNEKGLFYILGSGGHQVAISSSTLECRQGGDVKRGHDESFPSMWFEERIVCTPLMASVANCSTSFFDTTVHQLIGSFVSETVGIGVAGKVDAYDVQQKLGLDTVEANRYLGLPDDMRDYRPVPDILKHFEISSISLMTNNPRKVEKLSQLGIKVDTLIPIVVNPASSQMRKYMTDKASFMGHLIPRDV